MRSRDKVLIEWEYNDLDSAIEAIRNVAKIVAAVLGTVDSFLSDYTTPHSLFKITLKLYLERG